MGIDRCSDDPASPARSFLPEGFSAESPECGTLPGPGPGIDDSREVFQSAALEVQLRVPTNASGFRIGSNFFTREYPQFICSPFNDVYAILRDDGGEWTNLAEDAAGNPISVNNALLEVCRSGTHGGRDFACPFGASQLSGTGFDYDCGPLASREVPGGATGWVCTDVPANGGEIITLRFAIWDTGDPILTSLALIDGFAWLPAEFTSVMP